MHDLKIETGWEHQQEWCYAWCPCGWKTEITYVVVSSPVAEFKRKFHAHLQVEKA